MNKKKYIFDQYILIHTIIKHCNLGFEYSKAFLYGRLGAVLVLRISLGASLRSPLGNITGRLARLTHFDNGLAHY
jgi:hypothetical protein